GQPFLVLANSVNGGRAVRGAAALDGCTNHVQIVVDANAPVVDRPAVGQTLVAGAGHGQPGVVNAPTQRRRFLAVIHVAVYTLAVEVLDLVGKEIGNVLVSRPVHRHVQLVAVFVLELFLQVGPIEPVLAVPVQI